MAVDLNITPTAGMPPVTTESSGATSTSGSERIVPSAASTVAAGGLENASADVASAEAAVNPATTIEGQAAGKDVLAQTANAEAAERQKLIDAQQPFIDMARRQAREAEDSFANHKFYDYLKNRSTGDRIVSRIAAGLVGAGNGLLGISGNAVLDKINNDVNRDFEQQKVELHSKEQLAAWRREGVKDLYDQLQRSLAALDMKQAKAHEAVALKVESMALRAGIPEAVAKQNVVVAKQNEAAAAKKLEAAQRYENHAKTQSERSRGTQETSAKAGAQAPVYDANGQPMGTTDAESARKVNTELGVMRQAHDTLNDLIASYKKGVDVNPATAATTARERVAMQEEIKSLMPQVKGFTRLTAEDMKVFDAILGGKFDAFIAGDSGKALAEGALSRLRETADKTVQAHGVKPTATILNPKGVSPQAPKPTGAEVKIKSGPYAGRRARDLGNGKYELLP